MTTNRLYTLFSLITLLALVSVGVLAIPMVIGSRNVPANTVSGSAEQARLEFRRGEWNAGRENLYAPLDQHERHLSVPAAEPLALEFQRYLWYHGQPSTVGLDLHDRHPERRGG